MFDWLLFLAGWLGAILIAYLAVVIEDKIRVRRIRNR